MPKAFDNCVRRGGKVRTKKLSGDKFIKLCRHRGKWYRGHVQKKKK